MTAKLTSSRRQRGVTLFGLMFCRTLELLGLRHCGAKSKGEMLRMV